MKIQVNLPKDLEIVFNKTGIDKQEFIINAIREKINKTNNLESLLKEGYAESYDEDLEITNDFESTDLENWK